MQPGWAARDVLLATVQRVIAEARPANICEIHQSFPKFEIWFTYADGTHLYSGRRTGTYDINFLTLGYVGEGPRYAKVFLEEAGFSMSAEDIDLIRPGAMIELS